MAIIKSPLGHVTMIPKGAYTSATTYNRLDLVTYVNSGKTGVYICKENDISNIPPTNTTYWMKLLDESNLAGPTGPTGTDGTNGRGIQYISGPTNPGQPGVVDTYTIRYTDNTTSTFQIRNGTNGQNGLDGVAAGFGTISATVTKLAYGSDPSVNVTPSGSNTAKNISFAFGIPEGAPGSGGSGGTGADGTGISLIQKTSTSGLEDTYTIYLTDGTNYPFTVTNGTLGEPGPKGDPGQKGDQGQKGDPGKGLYIVKTYESIQDMEADANNINDGDFVSTFDNNIAKMYMKNNLNGFTYISNLSAMSIEGPEGPAGNGIYSIYKTSTSGLEDTYTIRFTDQTESTFVIKNGAPGEQGLQGVGIASITGPTQNGLIDTYTINFTNGTTKPFLITNGQNGRGIVSVSGPVVNNNINTYTINYTDGTTSNFTITNSENSGSGSSSGINVTNPLTFTLNNDKVEMGLFASGGEANIEIRGTQGGTNAPAIEVTQYNSSGSLINNRKLTLLDTSGNTFIRGNLNLTNPLSIANGGTGLTEAPSMLVNLSTTSAANPLSVTPRPGVTGTLSLSNGGTGKNLASSPTGIVNLQSNQSVDLFTQSPTLGVTGILQMSNGGVGVNNPGMQLLNNLGIIVTTDDIGEETSLTTGYIVLVYEDNYPAYSYDSCFNYNDSNSCPGYVCYSSSCSNFNNSCFNETCTINTYNTGNNSSNDNNINNTNTTIMYNNVHIIDRDGNLVRYGSADEEISIIGEYIINNPENAYNVNPLYYQIGENEYVNSEVVKTNSNGSVNEAYIVDSNTCSVNCFNESNNTCNFANCQYEPCSTYGPGYGCSGYSCPSDSSACNANLYFAG